MFDTIPWDEVRDTLHAQSFAVPAVPAYSDFVDRSASGQEDLVIAFSELFSAPSDRHVLAFTLAAFIDVIVFLLAYASGPFFFGAPEERWFAAGAALDSADEQVFVRDLLRKLAPSRPGAGRLEASALSAWRAAAVPAARRARPGRHGRGGRPALLPARRLAAPDARRVARGARPASARRQPAG